MAVAVRQFYGLERLDLVVSRTPLGKEVDANPRFEDRIRVLREVARSATAIDVRVTEQRLLADIGQGYDLMVLGADKWHQIHEDQWYRSPAERDAALARLPRIVVYPRDGAPPPPPEVEIDPSLMSQDMVGVSSTRARSGELDIMAPSARLFAERTGAWIDDDRYQRWLDGGSRRSRAV